MTTVEVKMHAIEVFLLCMVLGNQFRKDNTTMAAIWYAAAFAVFYIGFFWKA